MKTALFLSVVIFSTSMVMAQPTRTKLKIPVLKAVELHRIYLQNEIAADMTYKEKKIVLDGGIHNIGRHEGQAYVELVSAAEYRKTESGLKMVFSGSGLKNHKRPVRCYFDKDEERQIARLRSCQHIRIIGVCEGKHVTGHVISGAARELGKEVFIPALIHCQVWATYPSIPESTRQHSQRFVYTVGRSKLFHRKTCRHVSRFHRSRSMGRTEAINQGYRPCAICNP